MKPISNGIVALHDESDEANGFGCMKLIEFLTKDAVTQWVNWHKAHLEAEFGNCPYADRCPIYARSAQKHLPLFTNSTTQ